MRYLQRDNLKAIDHILNQSVTCRDWINNVLNVQKFPFPKLTPSSASYRVTFRVCPSGHGRGEPDWQKITAVSSPRCAATPPPEPHNPPHLPLPCKARSDLQHSLMLNCVPRRAQLARAQRVHAVRRQVGRGAVLRVTDVNHSDIHKDTSHRNTLM